MTTFTTCPECGVGFKFPSDEYRVYCSSTCEQRAALPHTFKPVRWCFDGMSTFDGFTDGTHWNGWLNVEVTPEVHEKVVAEMREQIQSYSKAITYCDDCKSSGSISDIGTVCRQCGRGIIINEDYEELNDFLAMEPNARGRISYAYGYCTFEDDEVTQ